MSAYRLTTLAKIKKAKTITLSRKKARETEKILSNSRKRYEKLLRDSFLFSFLGSFRITIFGSGMLEETNSEYFKFVESLTKKLGKEMQVDIITGGGGGLMLAANEGLEAAKVELKKKHRKIHCENFGLRVNLPEEIGKNENLDVIEDFQNFSTRLEEFVRISHGIYLAPGGFGTDLEAAMFVQLKQRWKIEQDFPILAHPFWKPIFGNENKVLFDDQVENGHTPFIEEDDKEIIYYTKDLNKIVRIFKKRYSAWKKLREKVKFTE